MHGSLLRKGVALSFILLFSTHMVNGARYKIKVTTADEYLAGTSANVFIDIIGVNDQSTGSIELDNKGDNDFERGATNTFYRYAKLIKPIKAIKIRRSHFAINPNWKLDKVVITVDGSEPYTFYFNKWIDKVDEWETAYEENECRAGISKCEQLCVNTNTGYDCGCQKGYQLDGKYSCKDVDECTTGGHSCDLGISTCINTLGAFTCRCASGYKQISEHTCQDVDECETGDHECDLRKSHCVNKPGSYSCQCREGFVQIGNNCLDVNECMTVNHKCDLKTSKCVNNPGSYSCQCREGFVQNEINNCSDVDECVTGGHKCDLTASKCVNKPGTYTCQCKEGFVSIGDDKCRDVDECVIGNHTCNVTTSRCVNEPGNYSCHCKEGLGQTQDGHCRANQCNGYEALGMENGKISNQSITASSHYTQYPPWSARLNAGSDKGWYALPSDYPSPWIQVDLGKPTWLKGVATQGKRFTIYVKTYKLAYSLDKVTWFIYRGNGQSDKVFNGNTDPYRVATNDLDVPVYTRYVRIYPRSWNDGLVLKLELYGCSTA